jgi:hypothetical protein
MSAGSPPGGYPRRRPERPGLRWKHSRAPDRSRIRRSARRLFEALCVIGVGPAPTCAIARSRRCACVMPGRASSSSVGHPDMPLQVSWAVPTRDPPAADACRASWRTARLVRRTPPDLHLRAGHLRADVAVRSALPARAVHACAGGPQGGRRRQRRHPRVDRADGRRDGIEPLFLRRVGQTSSPRSHPCRMK